MELTTSTELRNDRGKRNSTEVNIRKQCFTSSKERPLFVFYFLLKHREFKTLLTMYYMVILDQDRNSI